LRGGKVARVDFAGADRMEDFSTLKVLALGKSGKWSKRRYLFRSGAKAASVAKQLKKNASS